MVALEGVMETSEEVAVIRQLAGAGLEPTADRDAAGHLSSHGQPLPPPGGVAAVQHREPLDG
jgi:hypothetical protein